MKVFFDHLKAMGNLEGLATDYPVMFINMVKDTLNNIDINNDELERKIKVLKSNYLLHFDNIETVNNNIQDNILMYGKY